MPWSGSGSFSRSDGTFTGANVFAQQNAAGVNITDTRLDLEHQDMANGLNNTICRDGQNVPSANLPMSGFRHTGVGNASARDQYTSLGQTQDGTANWVAAGGTADALTATYSPALAALVDGQLCFVRAGSANATTTPTFSPNGLTAHTVTKLGGTALRAGDIAANQELALRYNLASTRWELQNPRKVEGADGGSVVLISTQTASGATSIDFTSGIDGSYDEYEFVVSNLSFSAATTALLIQISEDAGATWKAGATDYKFAIHTSDSGGAHSVTPSAGSNAIQLMTSASVATTANVLGGRVQLYNPSVAAVKPVNFQLGYTGSTTLSYQGTGNYGTDGNAVTGIRFKPGAGTISGTISLYGRRK